MNKQFIAPQQLLNDAHELGFRILDSGFQPEFLVAIWRGGTPVGIAVHELLDYFGVQTDHIAIRTTLYSGIGRRAENVQVLGSEYLESRLQAGQRVLLVDDVFDSGLTVARVIDYLQAQVDGDLDIRVATPYYKPANNQTDRQPDYYVHSTNRWLVFPHELVGLSPAELLTGKSEVPALRKRLLTNTS